MPARTAAPGRPTLLQFNREIVVGECGSLAMAYVAAFTAARFTAEPSLISAAVVAGTLVGGTLFWCSARILHQRMRWGGRWSARALAGDIGYFTPAAVTLGFAVYDPVIYFASRLLLLHGFGIGASVIAAQILAFSLFLGSMNAYRLILARALGKHL